MVVGLGFHRGAPIPKIRYLKRIEAQEPSPDLISKLKSFALMKLSLSLAEMFSSVLACCLM